NVTTNRPIPTPILCPFNSPPSNPANASKLIWYRLTTLAQDKISPATTPTVEPIAAPPTKANNITKYLEKICSTEAPYISQPIVRVNMEAVKIIMQTISSFIKVGLYLFDNKSGILCINLSTRMEPNTPSTIRSIHSY